MPVVAFAVVLGSMWLLGRLDRAQGPAAFVWLLLVLALIAGTVLAYAH